MAVPLRGGGKGLAINTKRFSLSKKKFLTAIKLERKEENLFFGFLNGGC